MKTKILHFGEFAILKSELAYVSYDRDDETLIHYFLKGNSNRFSIQFENKEMRDESALKMLKAMEEEEL